MRKMIVLGMLSMLLVCGCSQQKGNFHQGNLDMERIFIEINKQISTKTIDMAFLNDKALSKQEVEDKYTLDMTKIETCMVKQSFIPTQVSEIALFKVAEKDEQVVKDAIQHRLATLETTWGRYQKDVDDMQANAKQGRIGRYYYFVLGEDSEKVVNYMKSRA